MIQVETAMGAAVEVFPDSRLIEVGRDRFVPVKTTNDLLVLRSDVYDIGSDFVLDQVSVDVPFVDLDGKVYKVVAEFDKRFPEGTPSMRKATSLTVDGDFTFGAHVQVVGDVELDDRAAPSGSPPTPSSRQTRGRDRSRALLGRGAPRAGALRRSGRWRRSTLPLLDALGLVCAEDVVATMSLPSFDNSAMDGYAVRRADVAGASAEQPVLLPVVGEIGAGQAGPAHAGARHRRQDHDRRPGARRRRRGRPLRVDRPRHREGAHRRRRPSPASTSARPATTSRSATCW